MRARGLTRRAAAIAGPARRVAVCIGRWNAIRSGAAKSSRRSFSFAASTGVTVHPAARRNAAADARPNGCRPISYVLTRSALGIGRNHCILPGMSVAAAAPRSYDRAFFGHPRGFSTLFFTEMWERFSYYGMRALLILFMTAPAAAGGLGFDTAVAGAIYGLYTSSVYMACLPGGWIADRLVGPRRAVLYGGILIAAGHFSMAVPSLATFYLGLTLIVLGTGLLKGNVAVVVGYLYLKEDQRRDAGFSIFYMGINLGAFIAPLVCGFLGQRVSWHAGFGAAGVGMTLGLVQYVLGARNLGDAGILPAQSLSPAGRRVTAIVAAAAL